MDINSILSSYMAGSIYSNYNSNSMRSNVMMQKSNQNVQAVDSYEPSRSTFDTQNYIYSRKILAEKVEGDSSYVRNNFEGEKGKTIESNETTEEAQGGRASKSAESKTETKIINGQAYLIITTVNEDGTTSVRKVKLGDISSKGEVDRNIDTSLAESVTL